jgi:major membrane immunogen (membrane-anchored lipoprotein)
MNLKRKYIFFLLPIVLSLAASVFLGACQQKTDQLHDGYFTAETKEYDTDGWKEFLTIYVNNGVIATVEFNAYNSSGLLRSWDMDYISAQHKLTGQNPNYFPRFYSSYLIALQDPSRIQAISGGKHVHDIFIALAEAAIEQSRKGDFKTIGVPLPLNKT